MAANFMFLKIISNKLSKVIIKIPLLDRWLINQLLPPMLFAIGAFTAVSLSVGIMFDLVRKIVEFGLPLQICIENTNFKTSWFSCLIFSYVDASGYIACIWKTIF